jgi:hypothetical protein
VAYFSLGLAILHMPRKMSEAREAEFAELGAFLNLYAIEVKGISPNDPIHPSNVLKGLVTRFGKSKALEGLRQVIGDVIEETQRLSTTKVAELDNLCRTRNVATLSHLRTRYWSKYASIVKRGAIRNDTEYYLVVGVLNDLSSPISDTQRSTLRKFANSYEQGQA